LGKTYANEEDYEQALSDCHKICARITRKAIEANAGIYIKLGQHIGALTYIFPDEWTDEMIPLQDKCPVSSLDSIRELFVQDTGMVLEEMFSAFDPVPLGTASLAQVHRATLKENSEEVAVKIQHPSLKEFVPLDVFTTVVVFRMIDFFFPEYPLGWLSDELQRSIYVELDFREEAKNAIRTQQYFKDFYKETALRIPHVVWAKQRILVMEFIKGGRPDDLEFLDRHHISRSEVSSCFAHIFNNMIFTPGVGLHCDPHPGNIAIRPLPGKGRHNFEIILYDHGLYRYVPTETRRSYAHFWLALIDGNDEDMRFWAHEFAGINSANFNLFAAAITGRDFENATKNIVSKREKGEIEKMSSAISESGLISEIMVLLHSLPRIVLLILKTNDLTRLLDEKLDSPLGVERTFLIMATYCARTVYYERRELIARWYDNTWTVGRVWAELNNLWSFWARRGQLVMYDTTMYMRKLVWFL
jgi:aarF domain-containing kinase